MGNKLLSLSFKADKMSELSSMIVVILGNTGTGKSKLAIELATKFNGEIISADSMQAPEGKLLFESDSDAEIEVICDNEHINENIENMDVHDLLKQKITQDSLDKVSSLLLHKALQQIDPDMANTLHPMDRRKVIRSLQVYQQHGQCHSELLRKQRNQVGGSSLGGPLRYKNSVMLWLQCDKAVLDKRLDDRVDDMLKRGLIDELLEFHQMYNEGRLEDKNPSYQEGIFQSIGFKEFHEYLILPHEEKNSKKGQKTLAKGIEDMKLVTRQYARKQTKWVENRFLRQPKRQLPPVYGLDATHVDQWNETVLQPAIDIIQSLLENKTPYTSPLPIKEELQDVPETHYCEVCERIFVGRRIWEIHLKSKRHSKRKASLTKKKNVECIQ